MQHTTNYNLSQYETTDRVTRDAFNADNLAIDAALKANADAALAAQTAANSAASAAAGARDYVKLLEATCPSNTAKWDIDVSSIDINQYARLFGYPNIYQVPGLGATVYLRYNNINSESYMEGSYPRTYAATMAYSSSTQYDEFALFTSPFNLYTYYQRWGNSHYTSTTRLPLSSLAGGKVSTLSFWCYDTSQAGVAAGSKLVIYGLKK